MATEYNDVVKSGTEDEVFKSGSRRDSNDGRGRFDLIPPWPLIRLAKHYENGAKKYGDRNWERGQPISRYINSIFRHLVKYIGGDRKEDHMAAIAWNAFAIIDHEERLTRGLIDPKIVNESPLHAEGSNFASDEFVGK